MYHRDSNGRRVPVKFAKNGGNHRKKHLPDALIYVPHKQDVRRSSTTSVKLRSEDVHTFGSPR